MMDTRTALLDAGVRLYGSMAGDLLRGLSAGAVATEAGFHRQTFYRYWETQSEYVQDLMRHVLGPGQGPVADAVAELVSRRTPPDLDALVHALADEAFLRVSDDPAVLMRVGLVAMDALRKKPAAELAQAYYDETLGRVVAVYDELFEALDRTPAAPASTRDLARLLQAMLLGLVLQSKLADDEPYAGELFELGARVLLEGMTESSAGESATG